MDYEWAGRLVIAAFVLGVFIALGVMLIIVLGLQ
jgi:hypothetical protein